MKAVLFVVSFSLGRTEFSSSHVDKLEEWINEMDEELPPLTAFILPVSQTTLIPTNSWSVKGSHRHSNDVWYIGVVPASLLDQLGQ